MAGSERKVLPTFRSLDELVDFFDTVDVGDYWDQLPEADFEVDLKGGSHLFTTEDDLARKLSQIAGSKGTPCQELIDSWLREKILQQT